MEKAKSKRSLLIFTSLPKIGGHTTITVGLAHLLGPYCRSITVIAKELPGHGVSKDAIKALRECGVKVRCIRPGSIGILQIFPAVFLGLIQSARTCGFLTIDMGRISPRLALLFQRDKTVYYHIKHELTPTTLRLLEKIESTFNTLCFISAATARDYAKSHSLANRFPVLIQPSQMKALPSTRQREAGAVRFGFLGRLSEAKGSKVLLDYFEVVGKPCELYVAGQGEFADKFRIASESGRKIHYVGSYDLSDKVDFLSRFFSTVDYLLVPTQDEWEGTPTVILEALQFGVPTLATACGGTLGFSLEPFNNGREDIVRLIAPKDFLMEIDRTIDSGPPQQSVAEKAVAYFNMHFSDHVIKTRWLQLLGLDDIR